MRQLVPKDRQGTGISTGISWVRHRQVAFNDGYGGTSFSRDWWRHGEAAGNDPSSMSSARAPMFAVSSEPTICLG